MTSNIPQQMRARQAMLQQERSGVVTARKALDIAQRARQAAKKPANPATQITTAINTGQAVADLFDSLGADGTIDNQTTAGNDPVEPAISNASDTLDALQTPGFLVRVGPGHYIATTLTAITHGPILIVNPDGSNPGTGSIIQPPLILLDSNRVLPAIDAIGGSIDPANLDSETPGILVLDGNAGAIVRSIAVGASANITVSDGDGVSGDPTIDLVATPHLTALHMDNTFRFGGVNTTPTLTLAAGAGSTAAFSNQAGGNYNYTFTLTPGGTGIAAGLLFAVAFGSGGLSNASYQVIINNRNNAAAGFAYYVQNLTSTGFNFGVKTALTTGVPYNLGFMVVGW